MPVQASPDAWDAPLLPEEEVLVARAVAKRRREFAAGRHCARKALARLGWPGFAVLAGANREPLWPPGIVGSITHCRGYCAAAVARATDLTALGIDAELNAELPPGVLRLTSTPREQEEMVSIPGVSVPALVFSAKESIYKAWYPLAERWLGYLDAEVELDPAGGRFAVRLLVEAPPGLAASSFRGRFAFSREHVFTAVTVER